MNDISGETDNKSKNFHKSSEGYLDMENKEEDNTAVCMKEIDKTVISQSAGEGFQDGKDQPEAQLGNQNNTLNQMSEDNDDTHTKDSGDNGSNVTSNQYNDSSDENQNSHAVQHDGKLISVPGTSGRGNLNIIEDDSTEPDKHPDKDFERHKTSVSVYNMGSQEMEKEEALAALRTGQTYYEEEDFDDYSYLDDENYYKAREKFVYFWKSHDIYSQWHRSDFYVEDKNFFNAEQYMMFKKAVLFDDDEIAQQILKCKDPRKIKALGRQVSGFDQDIWQQHCLYIVKEGNRAKFLHNDNFLAEILFTYPKVLVEASPLDYIWGIGLAEEDPKAWDENTWQGTNYLGYVLTEVRDDIMVERGMIDEEDREKYTDNILAGSDVPSATANKNGRKEEISREGKQGDRNTYQQKNMDSHATNKETYLLFDSFHYNIYSQFYQTYFWVDDIEFSSAEQYMMYRKARLFNDDQTAKEILNKTKPGKIKQLGKRVKGFDEAIWQKNCLKIVKEGNKAKFSQDEKLKKAIVTTYPQVFAEANPHDKIWGIGLEIKDPKAEKRHTWQGRNFLGYVLTEVRDELMYEWGLLKKEKKSKYVEMLEKDWVENATINNQKGVSKESYQTYHSRETNEDERWENRKDKRAPTNKNTFKTKETSKRIPAGNMKTDHQHEKHNYDSHDHMHQKHNDTNKRERKNTSQKGSAVYHHHEDNSKKNVEKYGNNTSSKDNGKHQDRTHSPLRNEAVVPKVERQRPVTDAKDQRVKTGQQLATLVDRDSKQTEEKVKSKGGTKKEKKSQKANRDSEKQEIIVEEFDIEVVKASVSFNDQALGNAAQFPSNTKGKKKNQMKKKKK